MIQDLYNGVHALTQYEINLRPKTLPPDRIRKPEPLDIPDDALATDQQSAVDGDKIMRGETKFVGSTSNFEENKLEET